MDTKPFEYIIKIAETGNITKAAHALFISQPYLSSYLTKLEEELGVILFDRTAKPLRLTYAGEKYLQMSKEIMKIRENFVDDVIHLENYSAGKLSIGIPRMRSTFLLPHILPAFYERFPNVEITVVEDNTKNLEEMLKKGMISFALTPIPMNNKELSYDVLYDEELLLICRKDGLKYIVDIDQPLSLDLVSHYPFLLSTKGRGLRTFLDSYFLQNKFKPQVKLEISNNETLLRLASKGIGLTIVPHSVYLYARPVEPIDVYHLAPRGLFWQIGVVYKANAEIDYLGRQFIEILRSILPEAFGSLKK
ncbi:LysR family transcriptional regulator [Proteiniclasticum ruminis]|uniref:DNA-binding transcriptional regulator, LysR family n=1 Tax=Proteiniclasticum ruminis TaxID=398199 RepID=A0A1G8T758_9CLOT|nr:LysR family transcriptional regulator [Proteiniclasticum ruminis]SDJ37469.1 DNA-binding transcriptional regulator, LysR family [Proteiniclasticum ruminis]